MANANDTFWRRLQNSIIESNRSNIFLSVATVRIRPGKGRDRVKAKKIVSKKYGINKLLMVFNGYIVIIEEKNEMALINGWSVKFQMETHFFFTFTKKMIIDHQ